MQEPEGFSNAQSVSPNGSENQDIAETSHLFQTKTEEHWPLLIVIRVNNPDAMTVSSDAMEPDEC